MIAFSEGLFYMFSLSQKYGLKSSHGIDNTSCLSLRCCSCIQVGVFTIVIGLCYIIMGLFNVYLIKFQERAALNSQDSDATGQHITLLLYSLHVSFIHNPLN